MYFHMFTFYSYGFLFPLFPSLWAFPPKGQAFAKGTFY